MDDGRRFIRSFTHTSTAAQETNSVMIVKSGMPVSLTSDGELSTLQVLDTSNDLKAAILDGIGNYG